MKKAAFLKGRTLLLVTLIAVLCSISIAHVSAQGATVRILESPIEIPEEDIGKLFNITVIIENVPADPGAVGVEFNLTWNPSVLTGVKMVLPPGHFMEPDGDDGNLWKLAHIVTSEYVHYAYTFMDIPRGIDLGYLPKSGSGTLAIITLNSTAPGATDLHFKTIKVGGTPPPEDPTLKTPIPTTPVDGHVLVVPEFPAFIIPFLFMVATLFAIILRRKSWLDKRRTPSR